MRRTLTVAVALVAALTAAGAILYTRNSTPMVPTIAAADAAAAGSPWVFKLHAQWCPVCMLTKGMWSEIEAHYSRLAVCDFTNETTTAATRAEAQRLGFATGTILVLDGRTREIVAWINDSRDFADYRAAIDAALTAAEGSR